MRRPLKMESFRKIRELNVPIETVLDIGILTGTGELMAAFKDKKHFLVEPIVEWNDTINASYTKQGIDYTLVNVAASNTNGVTNMQTSTVRPGQSISHAQLTQKESGENIRSVPVRTIDSLMAEYQMPRPYLLKIDVDGVELQIMEGAKDTFEYTNVVVVEASVRNFIERSIVLKNSGFELFDIVDPCYYDNQLRQFDLVFLNSRMVAERGLDMYKQSFDIRKWVSYK
jgi:FkbM family methyltransferase